MIKNRNEIRFFTTLFIVQIALCILTLISTAMLANKLADHTADVLAQQAIKISEERMRERVESVLSAIEQEQERTFSKISSLGGFFKYSMTAEAGTVTEQYVENLISNFSWAEYGRAVQVLFYNGQTQTTTLFAEGETRNVTSQYANKSAVDNYVLSQPYYEIVPTGDNSIYIFAEQEILDEISKDNIYKAIHKMRYGKDGYVWVNEILNYEGGDDYAIRVIHPNLKDSEGQYLSTNTTDVGGNFPYLTELEGINKNGEIFHTYYFSNLSDGQMAEKASYAKLYEPYNWIIATGDPLDTIFSYSTEMEAYNRQVISTNLRNNILMLVAVFVFGIVLIVFGNRKYRKAVRVQMEEDTKRNERLFNIVAQHSNRILYEYDLESGVTRPWNEENREKDILAHLYTGNYSEDAVQDNAGIMPDSIDDVKRFFADVHAGVPSGEVNVHIRLTDGQKKWYHFRYSNIYDQDKPTTAQ